MQGSEKGVLEGISQGRFVVDLIDQVCIEACHGGIFNSLRHFSKLGFSLFKFEFPRAVQGEIKT